MTADGTLTFWGVRGSIPAPGPHTVTFGGNTSCVSVEYGEHVVIFDAGSGLRRLGLHLLAQRAPAPIAGSLFLTHTHWDHLAREAQVKQLFLFHHDPEATDEHLNARQFQAQQRFPPTFVAREGLKIPLHSVSGR